MGGTGEGHEVVTIMPVSQRDPSRAARRRPVVAWLVLLSIVAAAVWFLVAVFIPHERTAALEEWRGRLSVTADDRAAAISAWVKERYADARVVAEYPTIDALLAGRQAVASPPPPLEVAQRHLREVLDSVQAAYGYSGIYVIDSTGRVAACSTGSPALGAACRQMSSEALQSGRAKLDLHDNANGVPMVAVVTPVRVGQRTVGTVLLSLDPERWLYPLLRSEPAPSVTGESLLTRQAGDKVEYLSPLRHGLTRPPAFHARTAAASLVAAEAVRGDGELHEYRDYRRVPVLGVGRRIPGTDWGLVVKVDRDEALAGFRHSLREVLTALSGLSIAAAGFGYGLWHRNRLRVRETAAASERRLAELVNEAGHAVLVLSVDGVVLQANRRAEELYGYSADEWREMTTVGLRAPEAREGALAALEHAARGGPLVLETVHRRRDGSTFPVEVSIHHADVRGERFLLEVVRDIGPQKAAEARIRFLNRLLHTISEVNQLIVRERDWDRLLHEACRVLGEHGGFRMAWIGFTDEASGTVKPAAWGGVEDGYLGSVTIRFDDTPFGRGPTGTAIREGHGVVVNDWEADERLAPWREAARQRGYRASASFPLSVGDRLTGALTVYMGEAGAFDAEVTALLAELARDIAFALEVIDLAARREAAERGLHESERRFRTLIEDAPVAIILTRDGMTLDVNAKMSEMFGLGRNEDAVGRPATDWLAPEFRDESKERSRRRTLGVPVAAEFDSVGLRASGDQFPMHVSVARVVLADGPALVAFVADITERTRAEEALKEGEARLRQVQSVAQMGFLDWDLRTGEILLSDDAYRIHGLERQERFVTPEFVAKVVHRDDVEFVAEALKDALEGVREYDIDHRIVWPDGTVRWVHAQAQLTRNAEGKPERLLGTVVDITERKRAEEALKESEERYRLIVTNTSDGIFSLDLEGRITFASPHWVERGGYTEAEVIGRRMTDFLPEASRAVAEERFALALRGEDIPPYEVELLESGGARRVVEVNMSSLTAASGEVIGRIGVFRDITERKRADDLKAAIYEISEAAQRAISLDDLFAAVHRIVGRLMEARNLYIALYDAATNLISFPYFVDEMDERPEPFPAERGMTSYVVRTGKPLLATPEVLRDLEEQNEVERLGAASVDWLGVPLKVQDRVIGVLAVQSYTGQVPYTEAEKGILVYVSGQVAQAIERKRVENELRSSEARFRSYFELPLYGIAISSAEKKWLQVNDRLCAILGYSKDELTTMTWPEITHPDDMGSNVRQFERLLGGEIEQYELEKRFIRKNGEAVWTNLAAGCVRRPDGSVDFLVVLVEDISERKAAEEALEHSRAQLLQAQKMEAVGRLAGGVAHDFNNVLQALLSQAQLLRIYAHDPERVKALSLELGQQISHGASLTRQLLLFSRRETARPEFVDLNDSVRDATTMLRRLVRANIAVEIKLASETLPVTADRGQLEQVLVNLTVNAADAMPEGGTLIIRTGVLDEKRVWLSVEDTGTGIPEAIRERIFEPFFTTKGAAKGTGLGLSVVHGIVTRHGGRVEVESVEGQGAVFRVILPAARAEGLAAAEGVPQVTAEPPVGRGERILVVEDEDAAREALRDILRSLGYEVIAAASGEEAGTLPVEEPFDVLLTDLMLPGIGGTQLAAGLQERWPSLRTILMSGYTEDEAVRKGTSEGNIRFLQKPFDIAHLAREIREALAE